MLPPMPDSATLEVMAWWAGTGALIGLGGWAIARIADGRSSFGTARGWDLPPVEVPGYKPPGEDDRKWTSPQAGLRLAAAGAAGGAFMGWLTAAPDSLDPRLELLMQLVGVAAAAFVLLRVMRDGPAVGEAPPGDPDETAAARLPGAVMQLVAAGLMALVAWFALR